MSERTPLEAGKVFIAEIQTHLHGDLPTRALMDQYQPSPDWFIRSPEGLHGIGHETRVFVWQEILSRLLTKEGIPLDQTALRWAASTHDVRRVDDGNDMGHGKRSAAWVMEQGSALSIPGQSLTTVAYLNTWHVPDDRYAPSMTPELTVFKDADGLDRARLGDLNPRYLRHNESKSMLVYPAEMLYELSSRKQWHEHMSSYQSVIDAAVELGLVV